HTRSKRDWSSDVCSSDLYNMLFSKASEGKETYGTYFDKLAINKKSLSEMWTKLVKKSWILLFTICINWVTYLYQSIFRILFICEKFFSEKLETLYLLLDNCSII